MKMLIALAIGVGCGLIISGGILVLYPPPTPLADEIALAMRTVDHFTVERGVVEKLMAKGIESVGFLYEDDKGACDIRVVYASGKTICIFNGEVW